MATNACMFTQRDTKWLPYDKFKFEYKLRTIAIGPGCDNSWKNNNDDDDKDKKDKGNRELFGIDINIVCGNRFDKSRNIFYLGSNAEEIIQQTIELA